MRGDYFAPFCPKLQSGLEFTNITDKLIPFLPILGAFLSSRHGSSDMAGITCAELTVPFRRCIHGMSNSTYACECRHKLFMLIVLRPAHTGPARIPRSSASSLEWAASILGTIQINKVELYSS